MRERERVADPAPQPAAGPVVEDYVFHEGPTSLTPATFPRARSA